MAKAKKPKQRITAIFKNNLIMIAKVAKYTPSYLVLMVIEGVVWGFINSTAALFSYNLLNAVGNGSDFLYAVRIIAVMAGFYTVAYAFDRVYWQIVNPSLKQKLHLCMHEELFKKAHSLDISSFDDPNFIMTLSSPWISRIQEQ